MPLRKRCLFLIMVILVCLSLLRKEWQSTGEIRPLVIWRMKVSTSSYRNEDDNNGYDNDKQGQWGQTKQTIHEDRRQPENATTATILKEMGKAQNVATATKPPTLVPTVTPTVQAVPPELLPKLPHISAFNFTLPHNESSTNGCFVNMTGNATLTHFPVQYRLDHLVEILQAGMFPPTTTGRRRKTICKYRKVGKYMHFPHMMQSYARCFSLFFLFSNQCESYSIYCQGIASSVSIPLQLGYS